MSEEQAMRGGRAAKTTTPSKYRATRTLRKEAEREPVREEGVRLTRNRKRDDDRFHINPSIVPEHMSYEWKRASCYGKKDSDHINNLMDNHWSPVPPDRHRFLSVEKDGMILMERPKYLTQEAHQETFDMANDEVKRVTKGLMDTPQGTFTRDHESVRKVSGVKTERNLALATRRDGTLISPAK